MNSSRICVTGVPPNCSEDGFKKHFSQIGNITDLRLYPKRKLAYVGYLSSDDAQKAVSFFNKSFMGMARLSVRLAEPYKFRADEIPVVENPTKKRKVDAPNPLLREFIETMRPSSGKTWANDDVLVEKSANIEPVVAADLSDDDYQDLAKPIEKPVTKLKTPQAKAPEAPLDIPPEAPEPTAHLSDADWLRRRTNRILEFEMEEPAEQVPEIEEAPEMDTITADEISRTSRLFVRNLPYTATEDDLSKAFSAFGELTEVHIPLDSKSGASKGFAHISFRESAAAAHAYELDGKPFQGRLLHVLRGAAKRDAKLDEFAIAKLPLKKQKQIKRKAMAGATFNWNSLYMNPDAVLSSVASRLGLAKSEILDPTSSDAAVKQAHAETHVIQETKAYFAANGVDVGALQKKKRSDTVILIKNFPFGTSLDELRKMLEEFGAVRRLLMPPSGTIAIAEFVQLTQARAAFHSLAYRRFRESVLFLEKGPEGLFSGEAVPALAKPTAVDLLGEAPSQSSTLFVRNLNFKTTSEKFAELFKPLEGFLSARVKTKPDGKGGTLSMGFGFLEFASKEQAHAAMTALNGRVLDGHPLVIKSSHKGDRKDGDTSKVAAARTKILIKNLPFEASKKDVRALFGPYGQLRSVRVPRKFDNTARGFAFADFSSAREAQNAMDSLRDSHYLGRKLVLAFAAQDAIDAETEIELMQAKLSRQADKVALAKLAGGRRRFAVEEDPDPNGM